MYLAINIQSLRYPTLSAVLPYFYVLRDHLNIYVEAKARFTAAARLMLLKLDKYYRLMCSDTLLVAVVLDPRFKLEFFVERGWSETQLGTLKDG